MCQVSGVINHATSSNLYRSYYPHRSRELVSPVCGIFLISFLCSAIISIYPNYSVTIVLVCTLIMYFLSSTSLEDIFTTLIFKDINKYVLNFPKCMSRLGIRYNLITNGCLKLLVLWSNICKTLHGFVKYVFMYLWRFHAFLASSWHFWQFNWNLWGILTFFFFR